MTLSAIVPFHKNLGHLGRCLTGLRRFPAPLEIIIVADAALDDCHPLAARHSARVLEITGPSGPAVARNRGAECATGDLLVFVDTDVVVAPGSFAKLARLFEREPDVDAAFGAYDEEPAEPHFLSQYKNLAHSYHHQTADPRAQTFWAGFGAVRATVFAAVGGFDERFPRPSVEDIDLDHRLTAAGYEVRLDHELRAQHLKRWTFRSLVASDILDRGIPWTQLILRSRRAGDDLNLRSAYRWSVVLVYVTTLAVLLAPVWRWSLAVVPPALLLLGFLNRDFYRCFVARRGVSFAIRVIPPHFLYHLYNGVSFAVGTVLYLARRYLGLVLPGALPVTPWQGRTPAPGVGTTEAGGDEPPS